MQRVPVTEASGRIHTRPPRSPCCRRPKRSRRGAGARSAGRHRTPQDPADRSARPPAVRLTHLPTGIVVTCQDERSQIKNKAKALRVPRARLFELERERADAHLASERRRMVGSGDRSEKIRTYNYPQNRVTDHRIGLTLHQLPAILEGDLDPLLRPLAEHFQAQRIEEAARRRLLTARRRAAGPWPPPATRQPSASATSSAKARRGSPRPASPAARPRSCSPACSRPAKPSSSPATRNPLPPPSWPATGSGSPGAPGANRSPICSASASSTGGRSRSTRGCSCRGPRPSCSSRPLSGCRCRPGRASSTSAPARAASR